MFDSAETRGGKSPLASPHSAFICLPGIWAEYEICPFPPSCLSPNYDAGDSAAPSGARADAERRQRCPSWGQVPGGAARGAPWGCTPPG